ncbi:MAG TPA: hypothetical protein VI685_13345, partial [Candidatus Angelobacter sp.]
MPCGLTEPPPPHPLRRANQIDRAIKGNAARNRAAIGRMPAGPSGRYLLRHANASNPIRQQTAGQMIVGLPPKGLTGKREARDAVVTLTFTVAGIPGVTVTLAGTVQAASCGAPVQANEIACGAPVSLSWKEKLAVCPAVTVTLPWGTLKEKSVPVPEREMLCGLSPALSAIATEAVRDPPAKGAK